MYAPSFARRLNMAVCDSGVDGPADSTYGSPVFSFMLSIARAPKYPAPSVMVMYGSDDSMVVERFVKSTPPIFFNVAVKSTVSPGSKRPLLLPPASSTLVVIRVT